MDWGKTLGPSSFAKDVSVSGPREFAMPDVDILTCEGACERGTNLAGTDNGALHKILQFLSGC